MKGFTTTFTTCKNMWSQVSVAMSMMLVAFLFSSSSFGQATVATNAPDYPFGATVYISGSGWTPGETVTLRVTHNPTQPSDATDPAHQPWNVVADGTGHITATWTMDADAYGASFLLTAHGNTSLQNAQTTFTDNFTVDFKQGANKDGVLPLGTIHWIGSILISGNSRIVEGMSTLQRVVFTDLEGGVDDGSGGTVHRLRIFLLASKASHHAYDFITGWNQALGATESLAPGFGLYPPANYAPCITGAPSVTYYLCNA